jgi:hypothetical protein
LYDFIHPNASATATVRSLLLLILKKVRLIITYPASTGRNFNEILRGSGFFTAGGFYKIATPVNWKTEKMLLFRLLFLQKMPENFSERSNGNKAVSKIYASTQYMIYLIFYSLVLICTKSAPKISGRIFL